MTLADRADPIARPRPGLVGARFGAGAHDPVTGPLPAVALHEGRMQVHVQDDVVIVTLDGGLDELFAHELAPTLAGTLAGVDAVVLDVDQVTLLDQAGFDVLAEAFAQAADGIDCCIVASRLTGRMVLERWGVTERHAVFTSVADALQARAYGAHGYGDGWRPERQTPR